jgi:hypothetical protein
MKDLRTWIAKRTSWRRWGDHVVVNQREYVLKEVAEQLFAERQNLVRKLAKTRRKSAPSGSMG